MKEKPFVFLDFDRCLGETDELYRAFETVINDDFHQSVDAEKLTAEKARVELAGGSFDVVHYLLDTNQIDETLFGEIEHRFIDMVRTDPKSFVCEGAPELMQYLDDEQNDYGIVTYGGQTWQRAKLRATGFDERPYLITDRKKKGLQIAEWLADGRVPKELGARALQSALLIDDKAASFEGLPETERGIQVGGFGPTSSHLSVERVDTLREVVERLKSGEHY